MGSFRLATVVFQDRRSLFTFIFIYVDLYCLQIDGCHVLTGSKSLRMLCRGDSAISGVIEVSQLQSRGPGSANGLP